MGLYKNKNCITYHCDSCFSTFDDLLNYVISLKSVDFSGFTEFNLELDFDIIDD